MSKLSSNPRSEDVPAFDDSRLQSTLEIPNVAAPPSSKLTRKTVILTLCALAVLLAGAAAARLKLTRQAEQQAQAKQDSGPRPMAALGPLKKEFGAAPSATGVGVAPGVASSSAAPAGARPLPVYAVPRLEPEAGERDGVRPIPLAGPVQGSGRSGVGGGASVGGGSSTGAAHVASADDAPMMLASTRQAAKAYEGAGQGGTLDGAGESLPGGDEVAQARQRLKGYQQQLGTLVNSLSKVASQGGGGSGSGVTPTPLPAGGLVAAGYGAGSGATPGGRFAEGAPGGSSSGANADRLLGMEKSNTPMVHASRLADRSLLMPKGTAFTCSLKTRIVSAVSGMVSCITARNVYSDDGRVLLVERGSHMDGEYRITAVKPGVTRIPVLWTRIRTPNGIVVELDSPGTGALGEGGVDGHVDNRWPERIGAALLLSFIDDLVRIQVAESQSGTTVYGGTLKEGSKLAEKVLESTINIPPLIYQNQGSTVGVYVARDVDFSAVYALRATELR